MNILRAEPFAHDSNTALLHSFVYLDLRPRINTSVIPLFLKYFYKHISFLYKLLSLFSIKSGSIFLDTPKARDYRIIPSPPLNLAFQYGFVVFSTNIYYPRYLNIEIRYFFVLLVFLI